MDPRDWEAAEWGAFGEVGAVVVAVVAGILVWMQVRHASQTREDQTRPYVIVDFEFDSWFVLLAIRNIGTSPAMDVRISFDPHLKVPDFQDPNEVAVFKSGIPMLAPGRLIAIPIGDGRAFFPEETREAEEAEDVDDHDLPSVEVREVEEEAEDSFPLRYVARVEYSGSQGRRGKVKRYRDSNLILDLTPFKHTLVERNDLHQIAQSLMEIRKLMKRWDFDGRLRVNTITHAEVAEAFRQRREQHLARQAVYKQQVEGPTQGEESE